VEIADGGAEHIAGVAEDPVLYGLYRGALTPVVSRRLDDQIIRSVPGQLIPEPCLAVIKPEGVIRRSADRRVAEPYPSSVVEKVIAPAVKHRIGVVGCPESARGRSSHLAQVVIEIPRLEVAVEREAMGGDVQPRSYH